MTKVRNRIYFRKVSGETFKSLLCRGGVALRMNDSFVIIRFCKAHNSIKRRATIKKNKNAIWLHCTRARELYESFGCRRTNFIACAIKSNVAVSPYRPYCTQNDTRNATWDNGVTDLIVYFARLAGLKLRIATVKPKDDGVLHLSQGLSKHLSTHNRSSLP